VTKRLVGTAVLVATLMVVTSCGSASRPQPSPSPSPSSGIYGIAVTTSVGPEGQPSPLPSGFGESTLLPIPYAHLVVKSRHGALVARVTADERGVYRLSLPPGTYAVWGRGPTAVKTRVVVSPGTFTRAVTYAWYH
jgi:hypothetical protein